MRPLFLSIEGFMAFRERVEIDFTHKSLFVLMGPTGSGKSSVLDAISFALFGETPRMGVKDLKKLLHHDVENPRLHAHVAYAFRHYGQDYRISRQISASGKHQVEIEIRANPEAEWEVHLTGKLSVFKKEIPRILGLDFEAFKKVILLPQGGFDKFLKQDGPGERRKFLMHLARLDVYDLIRTEADLQLRQVNEKIALLEGERKGIGSIEADELALREGQQKENQLQLLSLEAELHKQVDALVACEALWKLLQAQSENRVEEQTLEGQSEMIQELEQELIQARYLLTRASELEHLNRLQSRLERMNQELQALAQALLLQEQSEIALESQRQEWIQAEARRPKQEERLKVLQSLAPEIEYWQKCWQSLSKLRSERKQREQQVRDSERALQQATDGLSQTQKNLLALQQAEQGFDAESLERRLELLQELGPELRQLQGVILPELEALELKGRERKQKLLAEVSEIQGLKEQIQVLEERTNQARAQSLSAEKAVEEVRRHFQAEDLRQHLKPGDACPVCTQKIAVLPQTTPDLDLPRAQAAYEEARKILQDKEKELLARQHLENTQLTLYREGRQRHQDTMLQIKQKRQETDQSILRLVGLLACTELPQWQAVKQEFDELKSRLRQHKEQAENIQGLETESLKLEHRVKMAEEQVRLFSEERRTLVGKLDDLEAEYVQSTENLNQILGVETDFSAALNAELTGLNHTLSQLTELKQVLNEKEHLLQQSRLKNQTQREDLNHHIQELDLERQNLEQNLQTDLRDKGFPSLDEARRSLTKGSKIEDWEKQIRDFHSQSQIVLRAALRLEKDIAGRVLSREDLLQQQERTRELKLEFESLQHKELLEEAFLKQQAELRKRTWALMTETQNIKAKKERYQRIYTDLGTRGLPDFLAKRVMERVIQGGSKELMNLTSQRYSFFLDEQEELVILDAWNALEPRSVKTLSGGETFLASLALALALHDYLSAGVQLDSLFIDEGFGTLDPESLDLAAEVIEQLQMEGKCIGVITHIPELAERFESRIHVIKSETGALLEEVV